MSQHDQSQKPLPRGFFKTIEGLIQFSYLMLFAFYLKTLKLRHINLLKELSIEKNDVFTSIWCNSKLKWARNAIITLNQSYWRLTKKLHYNRFLYAVNHFVTCNSFNVTSEVSFSLAYPFTPIGLKFWRQTSSYTSLSCISFCSSCIADMLLLLHKTLLHQRS